MAFFHSFDMISICNESSKNHFEPGHKMYVKLIHFEIAKQPNAKQKWREKSNIGHQPVLSTSAMWNKMGNVGICFCHNSNIHVMTSSALSIPKIFINLLLFFCYLFATIFVSLFSRPYSGPKYNISSFAVHNWKHIGPGRVGIWSLFIHMVGMVPATEFDNNPTNF